jgi:hypothetical protein
MEREDHPSQQPQPQRSEPEQLSPEARQPAPDLLGQPEQLPHDGGLNAPESPPPKGGDVFQQGGGQSPDLSNAERRSASEPRPGDIPEDKLEFIRKSLRAGASLGPGIGLGALRNLRKDREEGSV